MWATSASNETCEASNRGVRAKPTYPYWYQHLTEPIFPHLSSRFPVISHTFPSRFLPSGFPPISLTFPWDFLPIFPLNFSPISLTHLSFTFPCHFPHFIFLFPSNFLILSCHFPHASFLHTSPEFLRHFPFKFFSYFPHTSFLCISLIFPCHFISLTRLSFTFPSYYPVISLTFSLFLSYFPHASFLHISL